ncbi:phasin family protein [Geminicoccus roseus]|uniref:phasin family protein n=1 Tax=Geminicoccus roseus TaxID=404900 RepID=UPI00042A6A36|nr:phasin family protein [Geminicoccus roseus]
MAQFAFPAPKFDADLFAAAQKRNVEAFTGATQIFADGMRTLAQRQSEIAQASMKQFMADSQAFLTTKPTEVKPADVAGKVKTAYESAIANVQELGNIVVKAQTDALNVLNNAAVANFDDMKKVGA